MSKYVKKEEHSKTKTSFYRRIYVAHLIDCGVNSVPAICEATGMPRRTAQDTIVAMRELGIEVEFKGGTKNGIYRINEWGAINPNWIKKHLRHVVGVLQYPSTSWQAREKRE